MNMVLWVRSSHEGALMLPVYPGICLIKKLFYRHFVTLPALQKFFVNIFSAEASFSAYIFWLFARQKQHVLAILRQKREKGRNKKEDQNWSCFFGRKVQFFPSFKPNFD